MFWNWERNHVQRAHAPQPLSGSALSVLTHLSPSVVLRTGAASLILAALKGLHIGDQVINLLGAEATGVVAVHDAFLEASGEVGIRVEDCDAQILLNRLARNRGCGAVTDIRKVGADRGIGGGGNGVAGATRGEVAVSNKLFAVEEPSSAFGITRAGTAACQQQQASLAVGILLGLQSSSAPDVYDTFSVTGTSHILVISGWNISIIAAALYGVAEKLRLSRRAAFWAILSCIWMYTLFVGATPTVIRAALMGTLVVIGQRLERPAHAWTTLLAPCWAMTIWNPQTLWDLGFQLSALATASLFAFGKGTAALLVKTPLRISWLDWMREALTATLAAQILALPLILYQFGKLSIIAPLANVALLPMVPAAMLSGALALLGGLVWLPLGQWLAPLAWLTEGVRLCAELPYAAVQLPPFPLWVLLGYYGIVVGGWLWNTTLQGE